MNILPLDNVADRNLGRILFLQSEAIPNKPCFLTENQNYSYSQGVSLSHHGNLGRNGRFMNLLVI